MEEILHQLIGSESGYLQGFLHPRWLQSPDFSSPSTSYQLHPPGRYTGSRAIFALRNFKLAKMAKRKNPISWVSGKSSRFFSKSWKNHGEKCSPCFFVRCSIKKISGIPKHADDLASRSPFLGTTGELREASEAKWWYLFIWKILKCSGNSNGNFYIHTPSIENSVNF